MTGCEMISEHSNDFPEKLGALIVSQIKYSNIVSTIKLATLIPNIM